MLQGGGLAGKLVVAQQEGVVNGHRELGRLAQSPPVAVEAQAKMVEQQVEVGLGEVGLRLLQAILLQVAGVEVGGKLLGRAV